MLTRIKKYIAMVLMICAIGSFVACDDDTTVSDEWTSTYVYLRRASLVGDAKTFDVVHTSDGVLNSDGISTPITVGISKAFSKDVVVKLKVTTSDNFPAEAVVLGSEETGFGNSITIPAGKLNAVTTLSINTDWAFALDDPQTYEISLEVESLSDADLLISPKQNTAKIEIIKGEKTDVLADVVPSGSRIEDRSAWKLWAIGSSADPTTTSWGSEQTTRKVFDGVNTTYLWYYTQNMSMKVDFGKVETLTGMLNYVYYGAGYSMSSCDIYASEDNITWTAITKEGGLNVTTGSQQYVSFLKQVKARYVIISQHGTYPLCSEWYFYGPTE